MSEINTPTESHNEKAFEAGEKYEPTSIVAEEYVAAPRTFGGKVKRHCSRFWWLHLITFCVIFLIIALCLVYVAMPRIAQNGITRSQIFITDLEFRSPTATTLIMTQKARLTDPVMYTPTLDPFNASLWLLTDGQFGAAPMLQLPMPRIHAQKPYVNASVDNAFVQIENLDQVTNFATAVLSLETVETALTGRTKLHLGALPTTWVNYNTTITQKGLNGLKGFNVTGVKINATALAGTPNLHGFAYIPNPSVMTIEMGNVTLTLTTAQQGQIGIATINDMTLVPGDNSLPLSAIVNQTKIIESWNSTGFVDLEILGDSSVANGVHLTYFEAALLANKLALSMNVKQILLDSAA